MRHSWLVFVRRINCALANRQIITHLVRQVFADVLPQATLSLLYVVSHNTCKVEEQALRQWHGRDVVKDLAGRGILIRSPSLRGGVEETPGAYKDVSQVVYAADDANLARRMARLESLVCVKG